jgi:toxin ParE1/3/4
MSKIYELQYHPAAVDDLYGIFNLIEAYAGTAIATRKLAEIEQVTKSLVDFPYKGSFRSDLPGELRAIPAAEKAVVCFSIREEDRSVLIVSIGYAGSDWVARAKERG